MKSLKSLIYLTLGWINMSMYCLLYYIPIIHCCVPLYRTIIIRKTIIKYEKKKIKQKEERIQQ